MLKGQWAADNHHKGAGKAMIDNERVGRNIMILRLEKGLSQQGLAELCSVTHQAVSKWEKGAALPDMQTLLFLSRYFDASMEDILTQELSLGEAEEQPAAQTQMIPVDTAQGRTLSAAGEDTQAASDQGPAIPAREENTALPEPDQQSKPGTSAMDWAQIVGLAPFASQQAVDHLIREKLAAGDGDKPEWGLLMGLMPFASQQLMTELLKESLDSLEASPELADPGALMAIAPFVSRDFLDQLVLERGGQLDMGMVKALAPFLSQQTVDQLVLGEKGRSPTEPQLKSDGIGDSVRSAVREAMKPQPDAGEKKSALLRIALKAVEDGNEDWLDEHAEDLGAEDQAALCDRLIQREQWDFLAEHMDEWHAKAQQHIISSALERKNWDFILDILEDLSLDEMNPESQQRVLKTAVEKGQWDFVQEAVENCDLPEALLQQILDNAMAASQWDVIDAITDALDL